MGTPAEFCGQGLGRAVLLEGLRRLRALGAQYVIVYAEADNRATQAFYRSVGVPPGEYHPRLPQTARGVRE